MMSTLHATILGNQSNLSRSHNLRTLRLDREVVATGLPGILLLGALIEENTAGFFLILIVIVTI